MGIILWLVFGGIVGWIASIIMKTNEEQGIFLNVIVGALGAFIGGALMRFFGENAVTGFDLYSFMVAIVGAIILLAIAKALRMV